MPNLLESGLLGGGGGGGLEAYIAATLPNVPASLRGDVATAANSSATGNGYLGADVINLLATLYSWSSWELGACYQDLAMTTLSTIDGPAVATKDFILGTNYWVRTVGSNVTLRSDKSVLFPVAAPNFEAAIPAGWTQGSLHLISREGQDSASIGRFSSTDAGSHLNFAGDIYFGFLANRVGPVSRGSVPAFNYEVFQASSVSGNYRLWLRNSQIFSTTSSPYRGGPIRIGNPLSSSTFWSNGQIKGIALASTYQTETERIRLYRFFRDYYGAG